MVKNMGIFITKPVKPYKMYLKTTNFVHILERQGSYFTWYSVDKGMIFSPFSVDKGGFVILPAAHPYQKLSKHRPGIEPHPMYVIYVDKLTTTYW